MKKNLLPATHFCLLTIIPAATDTAPVIKCSLDCIQWLMYLMVFAPLLIFLLIIIVIFKMLRSEGFKLGDALKENETMDISVDNPALETTVDKKANDGLPPIPQMPLNLPAGPMPIPPFVSKTVQPKSTSRLLAFISGLVSVGLASCFCTFWLYTYAQTGKGADMDSITDILLTLGLGVVPYAVNKVSRAFATDPK